MAIKNAEDIKCSDIIAYRGYNYVVLSSFTDLRHTQTIVTTIRLVGGKLGLNDATFRLSKVTVLRLFRTYKASVVGKADITIEVMENDRSEITDNDAAELDQLRSDQA